MAGLAKVNIGLTMRNIGETVTKDHVFTLSGFPYAMKQTGKLARTQSTTIGIGTMTTGIKGLYFRVVSSWTNTSAVAVSGISGIFLFASGTTSGGWTQVRAGEAVYVQPYDRDRLYHLFVKTTDYKRYSFEYAAFGA